MLTILPKYGWEFEMFDNPGKLMSWLKDNTSIYKILWTFYFISQACLLPVPLVFYQYFKPFKDHTSALAGIALVLGVASITLAISVLIIFPTISPILAEAYYDKSTHPQYREMLTLIHSLFADMAKEIRLFSEILLGFWLSIIGYCFIRRAKGAFLGWVVLVIGVYTNIASILKIIDPYSTLEDPLGFILATMYCYLGIHLLRYKEGLPVNIVRNS